VAKRHSVNSVIAGRHMDGGLPARHGKDAAKWHFASVTMVAGVAVALATHRVPAILH